MFTAPGIRLAGFGALTQAGVVLGARAEDLTVSASLTSSPAASPAAPISGEVFSFELTGDATLVTLQAGAQRITAKAGKAQRASIGQALGFDTEASRCFLFDAATQARLRLAP